MRRRRCLALALAAPGYGLVASTPLHHSFAALVAGLLAFAAALGFRSLTEPLFLRAEAVARAPQPAEALAEDMRARHA